MAANKILGIVAPIHSRIEEILPRLAAAGVGSVPLEHVKCAPRSCYVELGKQQEEEYVNFSRYCSDGCVGMRLPRQAFENDSELSAHLELLRRDRVHAATARKEERRRQFYELKKEFE